MTRIRLNVLKWWLRGRKNSVDIHQLARYFFAPSYLSKAKCFITKIEEDGLYWIVHLKGQKRPLYYPRENALVYLNQMIVETFYADNWHYYQAEETKVGPHDIVADCGAAEGLFSLVVEHHCKQVYAIEPLPGYQRALQQTFKNSKKVEIIPCALSDQPGDAYINDKGHASSLTMNSGYPVKVETLDKLFYDRNKPLTYIKADLEGYDFKAILGATKTILANSPKIAITTYHHPDHAKKVADYLVKIDSRYRIKLKGIYQETGCPIMLHAWRK